MKTQKRGQIWQSVLSYFLVIAMFASLIPAGLAQAYVPSGLTYSDGHGITEGGGFVDISVGGYLGGTGYGEYKRNWPVVESNDSAYYTPYKSTLKLKFHDPLGASIENVTYYGMEDHPMIQVADRNGYIIGDDLDGTIITDGKGDTIYFAEVGIEYLISALVKLSNGTENVVYLRFTPQPAKDTNLSPTPSPAPGQTVAPVTNGVQIYFLERQSASGNSFTALDPTKNYNVGLGQTVYFTYSKKLDTSWKGGGFIGRDHETVRLDSVNFSINGSSKIIDNYKFNGSDVNITNKGTYSEDLNGVNNGDIYQFVADKSMFGDNSLGGNSKWRTRTYKETFGIRNRYNDKYNIYPFNTAKIIVQDSGNSNPNPSPTKKPDIDNEVEVGKAAQFDNWEWGSQTTINFKASQHIAEVVYTNGTGDVAVGQDRAATGSVTTANGTTLKGGAGHVLYFKDPDKSNLVLADVYTLLKEEDWPANKPEPVNPNAQPGTELRKVGTTGITVNTKKADIAIGGGYTANNPYTREYTYNGTAQEAYIDTKAVLVDNLQTQGKWYPGASSLFSASGYTGTTLTNVADSKTGTATADNFFTPATYKNYLNVTGSVPYSFIMNPLKITGSWVAKKGGAIAKPEQDGYPLGIGQYYNGENQSVTYEFVPNNELSVTSSALSFKYSYSLEVWDDEEEGYVYEDWKSGNSFTVKNVIDSKYGFMKVEDSNANANGVGNYDLSGVAEEEFWFAVDPYPLHPMFDFEESINDLDDGNLSPLPSMKPFTESFVNADGITLTGYTATVETIATQPSTIKRVVFSGFTLNPEAQRTNYTIGDIEGNYIVQENDKDGDGMPDNWETANGLDPNDGNDAGLDPDNDGLSNLLEYKMKIYFGSSTDPHKADTDSDGFTDGYEWQMHQQKDYKDDNQYGSQQLYDDYHAKFDPTKAMTEDEKNADFDNDGLSNIKEHNLYIFGEMNGTITDILSVSKPPVKVLPCKADTDGDGLYDGWEITFGFDPMTPNVSSTDTDGDGLTDLAEFNWWKEKYPTEHAKYCDPTKKDTDGDGFDDRWEIVYGYSPVNATEPDQLGDPDNDDLSNIAEYYVKSVYGDTRGAKFDLYGGTTNPKEADTDGDGMSDYLEMKLGSNPLDPNSKAELPKTPPPGNIAHPAGNKIPAATKTDVTAYGKADGKITNTDTQYSIEFADDVNFTYVTRIAPSETYSGLPAGSYFIRYCAYDNYKPGTQVQWLTIGSPTKPPSPTDLVTHEKDEEAPQVEIKDETVYGKGDGYIKNPNEFPVEISPLIDFTIGNVILGKNEQHTLPAGVYYVRWAETDEFEHGSKVTVAVIKVGEILPPDVDPDAKDHPKKDVMPSATKTDVTAYGKGDGTIKNNDSEYAIEVSTDSNFKVSPFTIEKGATKTGLAPATYYVRYASYKAGSVTYNAGEKKQELKIDQPNNDRTGTETHPKEGKAPEVTVTNETGAGKADGSIKNLDATYEIEVSKSSTFNVGDNIIIAAGATKTLPCGTYYIRWAPTTKYKASTNKIDRTINSASTANTHPKDVPNPVEPNVTVTDETIAGQGGAMRNNDTEYDIEIATNQGFTQNYYKITKGQTLTGIAPGTYFIRYSAFGIYDKGKQMIVRTILAKDAPVGTPLPNPSATPIGGIDWSKWVDLPANPSAGWEKEWTDSVKDMIENQIINGFDYGNGTFGFEPTGIITRAQFCQIIAKMSGDATWASTPLTTKFSDIKAGDYWGNPAISWCVTKNVVEGYPEAGGGAYFDPEKKITRQEMAKMINRFCTAYNVTLPTTGNDKFSDIAGLWGEADIKAVAKAGIIKGYDPENGDPFFFSPQQETPRAQAAVMLYRLKGIMKK